MTLTLHGVMAVQKLAHVSTVYSTVFPMLFAPIWFTFIIYYTCLTNAQQQFQIMIGICQRTIVFLKTITTLPGNVNMSIEANISLNKPIFSENKTKQNKKNHAYQTRNFIPKKCSVTVLYSKVHPLFMSILIAGTFFLEEKRSKML